MPLTLTTFTVTSTTGKRAMLQVRMEGRMIASYSKEEFDHVADPHACALSAALAKRYAGDQGSTTPLKCHKRKSSYTVQTPV